MAIDFPTLFILLAIAASLYLAYSKQKIDLSAVVSTGIVGGICLIAGGMLWITPLFIFFVLGSMVSGYKRTFKKKVGVEQSIRTYRNVFSNGGAAAIFALMYLFIENELYFIGLMGAMATAMADTSATELGQVYGKHPRLILNMKKVPLGTPGGVSKQGLLFSLLGSGIISSLLFIWGYDVAIFTVVLISGFVGALIDSLLGASIERKGYIDTHMVNLIATIMGGSLAMIMS